MSSPKDYLNLSLIITGCQVNFNLLKISNTQNLQLPYNLLLSLLLHNSPDSCLSVIFHKKITIQQRSEGTSGGQLLQMPGSKWGN